MMGSAGKMDFSGEIVGYFLEESFVRLVFVLQGMLLFLWRWTGLGLRMNSY